MSTDTATILRAARAKLAYEAITTWVFLTAANFLWQKVVEQDYSRAFDRSYFQGVAIAVMWFYCRRAIAAAEQSP